MGLQVKISHWFGQSRPRITDMQIKPCLNSKNKTNNFVNNLEPRFNQLQSGMNEFHMPANVRVYSLFKLRLHRNNFL